MFSDAVRKVNHKLCNSIIMGTTNMEDTAKIISLLLLVFTLSAEANHGGEYFSTLYSIMKTEFPPSILSIVMRIH